MGCPNGRSLSATALAAGFPLGKRPHHSAISLENRPGNGAAAENFLLLQNRRGHTAPWALGISYTPD